MRSNIIVSVMWLLLGFTATAQPNNYGNINDLEDLWQLALQQNSTQQVYALQKQKAEADHKAAQGFYYPQVGAIFNGQDFFKLATTPIPGELLGMPGEKVPVQFGTQYQYNTGISVSKGLFDWQQRFQAKTAKENIALADAQQEAFEQNLKTQLAQHYFSWQVANSSAIIFIKDLELADSILQLTKQKFSEGLIAITPVNKAQIDYNNVQQNIYQSEELKQQAWHNIKKLAGMDAEDGLTLQPVSNLESMYAIVPELGMDKNLLIYPHNIAVSELQSKAAKAAFYPDLSLSFYTGFQQFRDNFGMSFKSGAWSNYTYLALNLNVPVFTGFATKNKLRSTGIQKEITEVQYEDAKQQSALSDSTLTTSFSNYFGMTATSKKTFELFGQNMELARQQYVQGLISLDRYLESFEDYLSAENLYLNNLSNLLMLQASIIARK